MKARPIFWSRKERRYQRRLTGAAPISLRGMGGGLAVVIEVASIKKSPPEARGLRRALCSCDRCSGLLITLVFLCGDAVIDGLVLVMGLVDA